MSDEVEYKYVRGQGWIPTLKKEERALPAWQETVSPTWYSIDFATLELQMRTAELYQNEYLGQWWADDLNCFDARRSRNSASANTRRENRPPSAEEAEVSVHERRVAGYQQMLGRLRRARTR